jgi:tetratricopeptide (TPR) repeat protein
MPLAQSDRTTWLVALGITVLALGGSVYLLLHPKSAVSRPGPDVVPSMGITGRGPDLGNMTSRQAFDRLFDRVLTAGEKGDTATALRFTEHALAAYQQLDSSDADARYHAAILNAQVGRYPEALALGDSILAETPGHLLGILVQGTVAALRNDSTALARARRDFLAAWSRDSGTGRPEYADHREAIDDFHAAARGPR